MAQKLWSETTTLSPTSLRLSSSSSSFEPLLTSIQYKSGVVIRGYVLPKKEEGKGTFQWTSGLQYTGEYKENKRKGYGELVWPDGSKYEGYFSNDVRDGHGKHTWGDSGEVYEGEYLNDKRHGYGTYRWNSGASFTGYFVNDHRVGKGVFISSQGERFEGNYNVERSGEGVLTYPGGHQDVGIWKGPVLIRLKFPVKEVHLGISLHSMKNHHHLHTPDTQSRGKHGPKGHLEIASQELIQEAGHGNLFKVKTILESEAVHVDVMDGEGHSALFASAINGYSDVVDYILDNGADVNQLDDSGVSVLSACHYISYSSHPKVKILLGQLQSAIEKNKTSSGQSSPGDTETLFTSQINNMVSQEVKEPQSLLLDFKNGSSMVTSLVRSRSLGCLNQACPLDKLSHGGHLYKVKSFPFLNKCHGDKRVWFRSSRNSMEKVNSWGKRQVYDKTDSLGGNLSLEFTVKAQCSDEHQGESLTTTLSPSASDNGELMGVSPLNSDVSMENTGEEERITIHSRSISSNNIHRMEPTLKPPTDDSCRVVSLLDVSQSCSHSSSLVTPTLESKLSKSHSQRSNIVEENDIPHSPQLKKHLIKTALDPNKFYSSSVFSSTRYGRIVSAAQSTTISVVDTDQYMSDESSTTTLSMYVQKPCIPEKNMGSLIKLLLSRGSDPNISSVPLQPLFYSVLVGDLVIARKMLERGANPNHCLPDELGGYSLLHVAVWNIGTFTRRMVELLLEYHADPNYGGKITPEEIPLKNSKETTQDEEENTDITSEDNKGKVLIAGENEGSVNISPLHVLCGVEVARYSKDREFLCSLIPWVIDILVKHGADVNKVANGHSPLSLAILRGHGKVVEALLEHGANPNIPLGRAVGNAMCALTTHTSHKARAYISTSSSLVLIHKLMMKGGNIFSPVRLHNWDTGTVTDFAHAAFKEDKRLVTLKYGSLTKQERARYRSSRRLMSHLRNIYRCRALQSCVSKEEWEGIKTKCLDNESTEKNVVRFTQSTFIRRQDDPIFNVNASNDNNNNNNNNGERRLSLSAGPLTTRAKFHFQSPRYLPEVTLNTSLNTLNRVLAYKHEMEEDDDNISTRPTLVRAKKFNKDKEKLPRQLRYKALFEKAARFLDTYKEFEKMHPHGYWTFSSFCYECGKCSGTHLMLCPNCEVVSYCSRNCKIENWKKGHKDECKRLTYTLRPSSVRSGKTGGGVLVKRPQSCL